MEDEKIDCLKNTYVNDAAGYGRSMVSQIYSVEYIQILMIRDGSFDNSIASLKDTYRQLGTFIETVEKVKGA